MAPKRFGTLGKDGVVVLPAAAVGAVVAAGASGFFPKIPPLNSPPLAGTVGGLVVVLASAGFGGAEKKLDGVDPVEGVA